MSANLIELRQKFEDWAFPKKRGGIPMPMRNGDGEYMVGVFEFAWRAYQEGAALAQAEAQPASDAVVSKARNAADPEGFDVCSWSFDLGFRAAERFHGIGTQPAAPSVPENGEYRVTFDGVSTHPLKLGAVVERPDGRVSAVFECDAPAVPDPKITGGWVSVRIADYNQGWNDCRSAMLAAAPEVKP